MPLSSIDKPLSEHILRTLLYFDIFSYPLTSTEIYRFLGCPVNDILSVETELERLKIDNLVFQFQDFFSVKDDNTLADRRLKGNREAELQRPHALKKARFISLFPFFRGIMISGSLSKNYMDEKSDLDFFIVAEPGRLWIARTIFDFYRKLFIRKKHYGNYCLNYFISSDRLTIEEQNIFTATELATVKPTIGLIHYQNLMKENSWISNYFPNLMVPVTQSVLPTIDSFTKKSLEKIINFFFADQLDKVIMQIRLAWFKRKYSHNFTKTDFEVAFKSKKYVSKAHSTNGQAKILSLYEKRIISENRKLGTMI